LDVITHTSLMIAFLVIAVMLHLKHHGLSDLDENHIRVVAGLGFFPCIIEFIFEFLQLIAFQVAGWSSDYVRDIGNYIDWLRIIADAFVMCCLMADPLKAAEHMTFSCVFAVCAFYKWIKILYALTPFRKFGLAILPILYTLLDVVPFFTVLSFHILGLVHGYISLRTGNSIFDALILVNQIGLLGEFSMDDLDGQSTDDYNPGLYYIVRILFLVVALMVTVTLMNTFIAALNNSFNGAQQRMDISFQKRRAECALNAMAVREGIKQLLGSKPKPSEKGSTLWYCCASHN